jgi:serine/threonine protein kinase
MSLDRLQLLEKLYSDALSLPPDERPGFLDRACAGDNDLRSEIESLLAYEQDAENYMERPACQVVAQSLAEDGAGLPVDRMLGRYQLLSLVGRGGMAEVYCAVDSRLNRLVAVKILPNYMASDQERVVRFEQEARAVAVLNHPNICVLHDIGSNEGLHYLVFEYLVGEVLSDRLRRDALPLVEAVQYATQIADALACAHEHGIIHLDLKPANIMILRSGVKLLDFGVSELRYPDTATAEEVSMEGSATEPIVRLPGTLGYMAPEQLEGRHTDVRADIFAFGAVLYEMITHQRAFPVRDRVAAARRLSPPRLLEVRPEIPAPLDDLVTRCLDPEPSRRWQTMSEVLSQCRQVRAGIAEG